MPPRYLSFTDGYQWNQLPNIRFPDHSSVHRTFQRWGAMLGGQQAALVVKECEELGGCVDWRWRNANTAMAKIVGGDESG